MDATCKVQDNIHVFRLVHNMCPGFWVHIKTLERLSFKLLSAYRLAKAINIISSAPVTLRARIHSLAVLPVV